MNFMDHYLETLTYLGSFPSSNPKNELISVIKPKNVSWRYSGFKPPKINGNPLKSKPSQIFSVYVAETSYVAVMVFRRSPTRLYVTAN